MHLNSIFWVIVAYMCSLEIRSVFKMFVWTVSIGTEYVKWFSIVGAEVFVKFRDSITMQKMSYFM